MKQYTVEPSLVIQILDKPAEEEQIADGFYLLCRTLSIYKIGTIAEIRNGAICSLENKSRKVAFNLKAANADMLGIERDEAMYLLKIPIEERVKNHDLGMFSKVKNLVIGSKCFFQKTECSIVAKNVNADGIKFDLINSMKKWKKHSDIDASEIRLEESASEKPSNKPGDRRQSSIHNILSGTGRDEQRTTLGLSTGSEFLSFGDVKIKILNPAAIKKIDFNRSGQFHKFIVIRNKNRDFMVKLLWKGIVDDKICLGVDLLQKWPDGTDGKFLGERLFTCEMGFGALIPVTENNMETCESGKSATHADLASNDRIKGSQICCLETKTSFRSAAIEIGNSVVYGKHSSKKGIVEWLGLVNGKECVGIICEDGTKSYKEKGVVHQTGLFANQWDKISIMDIKCVKAGKLNFIEDKIVDLSKILSAKAVTCEGVTNKDWDKVDIGDPIATKICGRQFIGEVKWLGIINNEKCVGLDMEDRSKHGMDGVITGAIRFECLEGHGLVTPLANVELSHDAKLPKFVENEIIDPKKYLKCKENWDKNFLEERKIKKDDLVSIKMDFNGDVKMKGTLRWIGFMNLMTVGVVELSENHENGTDGTFWRYRLFRCNGRRAIAVPWNRIMRDITMTTTHENMELEIISPQIRDLQIEPNIVDVRNLILRKGDLELSTALLWRGKVDDHLCIGCDLMSPLSKHGTDGTFDGQQLFQCAFGQGALIKLNDDINTCERNQVHKKVLTAPPGIIDPNGICCFETRNALSGHQNMKIGDQVAMKIGGQFVDVTCKWIGLVNNTEAMMIKEEITYGINRRLPKCKWKDSISGIIEGTVVTAEVIHSRPPIVFKENTFAKSFNKFTNWKSLEKSGNHGTDELVQVGVNPVFYGQIQFFMEKMKEVLVGVQLDADQVHGYHDFLKDIKFEEPLFKKGTVGFIVKINELRKFDGIVELESDSCFIKKNCIKYKSNCLSKEFQKNDFVQFMRNPGEYLVFIDSFLINKVLCFEVKKGIMADEPGAVEYVRQGDILKTRDVPTSYYQGAIINPRSLITFETWEDEDLKIGDKVAFRLRISLDRIEGTIKGTGKANGVPSSVMALEGQYDEEIKKCSINNIKIFAKLFPDPKLPLVIVENYLLTKERRDFANVSGVPVITAEFVKNQKGKKENHEKHIVFKCNDETRSGLLKWKGYIDERYCLGCELNFESPGHGTDGKFAQFQLFQCKANRGFLIPLDALKECCVRDEHKPIKANADKIIDNRGICCIKSKERWNENTGIRIDDRVKRKNTKETGICKWTGLVNNVQVIGLQLKGPVDLGTDGTFCDVKLFDCPPKYGVLCEVSEFEKVHFTLERIDDFQMDIVNPAGVTLIENGKEVHILMNIKSKNVSKFLNIKWKGCINGYFCFGCELMNNSEFGTDGKFAGQKLFSSNRKRAVLIPFDELKDSCTEPNEHQKICKEERGSFLWGKSSFGIDPRCLCCAEWKDKIQALPNLKDGSRVKVMDKEREIFGTCRWIGLINGVEAVGIEMDKEIGGRDGRFDNFELFQCAKEKGFLFDAADVIHDAENEKIHFIEDKIVDLTKMYWVQTLNDKDYERKAGDPVAAKIWGRQYIGEVKWLGIINIGECVGLDMEDRLEHGMDGVIKDAIRFECLKGHGLVTPLANVELIRDAKSRQLLANGIIDPKKYLKCEGKWDEKFLKERKIKRGELVSIKMDFNGDVKMKGTLKWSGFMNCVPVGAVELSENHENGTDGTFWRNKLFRSSDRRAIAIPLENIFHYEPYETKIIPEDIRPIKSINLNSAVKYYPTEQDGVTQDLFGTVKWTGINEDGEYFYGIELDDRLPSGTDGVFKRQKLFDCQMGHGILAPLCRTAEDTRFNNPEIDPNDVEMSKDSDHIIPAILSKLSQGQKRGIQGNANSCYFDSAIFALFSKSEVLDFMISPMINEDETNETTKEFRTIMAWKIIYPLREHGFVSFHKTNEMRQVIQNYGSRFAEMTKQESDMENVSALLSKLCPGDQLLSMKSHRGNITKSVFIQLFFNVKKAEFMTSEDMLKISMVQNDIMFEKLPTCLIMQVPRDAMGITSYEFVLPFNTIEISQICSDYFKKCDQCDGEARFQCKQCLERKGMEISASFRCSNHKCFHEEKMKIPENAIKSRSKVFMELKAIICIDKCHFVAYVKQIEKGNKGAQWYFFDSMSTQGISNNYAIPEVKLANEETEFLNLEDHFKQSVFYYKVDKLKRILKDSYIFVYENSAKTCY